MENRMHESSPEELLSYWENRREYFLCAMLWDEEGLSDLAAIQKVYGNIDEVKQRWTHDLIELDRILQEIFGNELSPQRISRQQDGFRDLAFSRLIMWCRQMSHFLSPLLFRV